MRGSKAAAVARAGWEHAWAEPESMAYVELVPAGYRPNVRVTVEAAASATLAA
jgi:hypothetical protein